jgi:hypothetical protein
MDNAFLRPRLLVEGEHGYAPGGNGRACVPDPVSQRPLAAEGENKPLDQYWTARIRDHDVDVCMPPAPAAPPPVEAEG